MRLKIILSEAAKWNDIEQCLWGWLLKHYSFVEDELCEVAISQQDFQAQEKCFHVSSLILKVEHGVCHLGEMEAIY